MVGVLDAPPPGVSGAVGVLDAPPPGVSGAVGVLDAPPPGVSGAVGVLDVPPPGVSGAVGVLDAPPPGVSGVVGVLDAPPPGVSGAVGVLDAPPPGVSGVVGVLDAPPPGTKGILGLPGSPVTPELELPELLELPASPAPPSSAQRQRNDFFTEHGSSSLRPMAPVWSDPCICRAAGRCAAAPALSIRQIVQQLFPCGPGGLCRRIACQVKQCVIPFKQGGDMCSPSGPPVDPVNFPSTYHSLVEQCGGRLCSRPPQRDPIFRDAKVLLFWCDQQQKDPSAQVVSGTRPPLISSPGMVPRGCYK